MHKNKTKLRKNHNVCSFLLAITTNKDLINKLGGFLEVKLKTNYYLRDKLDILCSNKKNTEV